MTNYFGTDGIRGVYGIEVTDQKAYQLGCSLITNQQLVVIGRDTRLSGDRLLQCLAQGITDRGGNYINLGIVPTNAVADYVLKNGADYGVMVSASHNPPNHNGLKVFDKYGVKLCEKMQEEICSRMLDQYVEADIKISEDKDAKQKYINEIFDKVGVDLTGKTIVLDCCYGSVHELARKLFEKTNAKLKIYCGFNQGDKINVGCGATYPQFLLDKMNENELGFSFDGDADRLAVLEGNQIIDNNRIFYAIAKYYMQNDWLSRGMVVGTVLTNYGLEKALNNIDIKLCRADVGDANIFAKMTERGANLGGEESGHYLLSDYATSSDALINAMVVSQIYAETGSILEYTKEVNLLPVTKYNLPHRILKPCCDKVTVMLRARYPELRVVIRPSGTEQLTRIFIEGDPRKAKKAVDEAINLLVACVDKP